MIRGNSEFVLLVLFCSFFPLRYAPTDTRPLFFPSRFFLFLRGKQAKRRGREKNTITPLFASSCEVIIILCSNLLTHDPVVPGGKREREREREREEHSVRHEAAKELAPIIRVTIMCSVRYKKEIRVRKLKPFDSKWV